MDEYIVNIDSKINDAIEIIHFNKTRCCIVVNSDSKVIGVISQGDVLRSLLKGVDIKSPIKTIINMSFKYINQINDNEILSLFKLGITLIPVVDKNLKLVDAVNTREYLINKFLI